LTVEELITTAYQATAASEQSSDDLDKDPRSAIGFRNRPHSVIAILPSEGEAIWWGANGAPGTPENPPSPPDCHPPEADHTATLAMTASRTCFSIAVFGQLRSVARVLERWRAAGFFPIFYHLKDQARRDVQNYRQRGLKASLIKTPKVIVASGRHNGRWAGLFERSGR